LHAALRRWLLDLRPPLNWRQRRRATARRRSRPSTETTRRLAARRPALRDKVRVDKKKLYDRLDQMRSTIPKEIR
jgi:hypothetical protein